MAIVHSFQEWSDERHDKVQFFLSVNEIPKFEVANKTLYGEYFSLELFVFQKISTEIGDFRLL